MKNVLVIKLSALGDFIQNLGLMRAIYEHHKIDNITLLTTKSYESLGKECGYFNHIIIDDRPKFFQIEKWISLHRTLNNNEFSIIYDLQNNDRSRLYHKLVHNKTCARIGLNKKSNKNNLAFYRHKEMLEQADISNITIDLMEWMTGDIAQFNLPEKYALIVPGCAPTRPEKRWPANHYIEICQHLASNGITPVILGTKDEVEITNQISSICNQAINLTGKTKLTDIPDLARGAVIAIGNDTGPMHIIGPTGCQSLVLFSGHSEPHRHKPLGENVHTLQEQELENLSVEQVIQHKIFL